MVKEDLMKPQRMELAIRPRVLVFGFALIMIAQAEFAFGAESCGRVKVRAGDACDFLNVVVDLTGCGENFVNEIAKVTCRSDGAAEVTFVSPKASYRALLKKSESVWTVAEPLAKSDAAESLTEIKTKSKKKKKTETKAETKPEPAIIQAAVVEPPLLPAFPIPAPPVPAAVPEMIGVVSKVPVTLGGSVRFRGEARDNLDFLDTATDSARFGLMRFRLDFAFKPRSDLLVFIQPQASRVWGKNEILNSGITGTSVTGASTATSGGVQDSRMDLHQGYLAYKPVDRVEVMLGRQMLTYGDELLIGPLEWHNVGRVFDAIKTSLTPSTGKIDFFWSKITERNDLSAGPGDKDLYGLYSSWVVASWVKQADVYLLHSAEISTAPNQKTTALGVRLKSPIGNFDYRTECTLENVRGDAEYQVDLEFGATLVSKKKTRISGEFFRASKGFDQFYPTVHKWLGYADYFSRKNIEGFRFGLSSDLFPGVSATVDYHLFARTSTDTSAFNLVGVGYGTNGNERALADELDVVLKSKLNDMLTLSGGGAWVKPGPYMKANKGSNRGYFYYAELGAQF